MTTKPRRAIAPLKVSTVGTPLTGDFRALAALLVKLDTQPPVKLVAPADIQERAHDALRDSRDRR